MTHFTEEELETLDIVWFAVDKNDSIGMFSTQGTGEIGHLEEWNEEVLGEIYDYVLKLPEYSRVVIEHHPDIQELNPLYGVADLELSFASKGLYVFNSETYYTLNPHNYVRSVSPASALRMSKVDDEIRNKLLAFKDDRLDFSSNKVITIYESQTVR